jgi:hypothetical protein
LESRFPSAPFDNKDDTTESGPPLNIEAEVYAFDGTIGGMFDDTLNVESVTAKVNEHELDRNPVFSAYSVVILRRNYPVF